MDVYCISEFKDQFDKLKKKKSYHTLEKEIIDYFFDKETEELRTGTNLNQSNTTPYIKKRICGSGGYRVYYLLVIIKDNVYLAYVHPKTGSLGESNLPNSLIKHLQNRMLESIRDNRLFLLTLSESKTHIIFTKVI